MGVALVENVFEERAESENIKFSVFKKMIKKDLEITYWSHQVISVLGEFKIYSDFRDELNSFDLLASFLGNREITVLEDSILGKAAAFGSESFLDEVISRQTKLSPNQLSRLADAYTAYLFDASSLGEGSGGAPIAFQELNHKYFNCLNGKITMQFRH